jgi:hypothetical protein
MFRELVDTVRTIAQAVTTPNPYTLFIGEFVTVTRRMAYLDGEIVATTSTEMKILHMDPSGVIGLFRVEDQEGKTRFGKHTVVPMCMIERIELIKKEEEE